MKDIQKLVARGGTMLALAFLVACGTEATTDAVPAVEQPSAQEPVREIDAAPAVPEMERGPRLERQPPRREIEAPPMDELRRRDVRPERPINLRVA